MHLKCIVGQYLHFDMPFFGSRETRVAVPSLVSAKNVECFFFSVLFILAALLVEMYLTLLLELL